MINYSVFLCCIFWLLNSVSCPADPLEKNWAESYSKAGVASVKVWVKNESSGEKWILEYQQDFSREGFGTAYVSYDEEGKVIFKEETDWNTKGDPERATSNFSRDIRFHNVYGKDGTLLSRKKIKDGKLIDSSRYFYDKNILKNISSVVDGVTYISEYNWKKNPLFPDVRNWMDGQFMEESRWDSSNSPELKKINYDEKGIPMGMEIYVLNKFGLPEIQKNMEAGKVTSEKKYEYQHFP